MSSSIDITDPLLPSSTTPSTTPSTTQEVNADDLAGKGVIVRSTSDAQQAAAADDSAATNPWATLLQGLQTGASNLSNLLPTGTYLAFSAIAPVITDNGTCDTAFESTISIVTLVFFAVFCFASGFTDSYQANDGKVYYGIVTIEGLWIPQLPTALHPGDKQQYKLTVVDVIHAFLSLMVFAALTLMTPTVRSCFYPDVSGDIVRTIPALVGFVASATFVTFPSTRHGIGFPVSPAALLITTSGTTSKDLPIEQADGSAATTTSTTTKST